MKYVLTAAILVLILSSCASVTVVRQERDQVNLKHALRAGIGAVLSGAALATGILSGDVPNVVGTILCLPVVGMDLERATHDVRIYEGTGDR